MVLAVGQHNLFVLLGFWGFLDVTMAPPDKPRSRFMPKDILIISALTVTEMGSRFLSVLQEARPFHLWNLPWRQHCPPRFPGESIKARDGGVKTETPFAEAFVHLFPDNAGGASLSLPRPVTEIREGTYVFHVTLPGVSRTIAMSYDYTLEDLHLAIQDAFDFDNDHLYAFYMDGKRFSRHAYKDPRCDEAPFADEAAAGQLDLYVGQRFLYFFDFGHSWEFGVELREISDAPHRGRPTIVAAKGTPPQQYPHSDW